MGAGAQLSCILCEIRKEKRFCPAVHGRICPQCCGEQREVTLDCPSDCVYLQQAREHEKPRAFAELDQVELFPEVEISQRFVYEQEHLITGLSFALAKSAHNRALTDAELIAALSATARTYLTLVNSGLHYQTPTTNVVQQGIMAELQAMVKQYRETEQTHL